jgi:hypothetical protein
MAADINTAYDEMLSLFRTAWEANAGAFNGSVVPEVRYDGVGDAPHGNAGDDRRGRNPAPVRAGWYNYRTGFLAPQPSHAWERAEPRRRGAGGV